MGGCACGAVRYRLSAAPILVNHCHCRLCQRQTGSTSVVNAFVESDALTLVSGMLDDPGRMKPDAVIFTADRMPWTALPQDIPQFEKSYDPAELLPPERFARLTALIARRAAGEG